MKHLTILVPSGAGNNLSSIVGAYKIFSRANEYWKKTHKTEVFRIQVAGTAKKIRFYDGLFSVQPDIHIKEIRKTDLIVIPSLNHNYETTVNRNKVMIDWIETHYRKGAEVASICTGAFLLASSGLLNGKSCSTHWSAIDDLRIKFPTIAIRMEKVITDEKGIYTNGGAYSFI
jgi:transcriptional regulator GlxA family with amidase domain